MNQPQTLPGSSTADSRSELLRQLLARCALNDRVAFAALYQATSAHLFGIVIRILKQRARAEEVLQEGFIKIWHHAKSYDANRGAPMTWMINIMRNQALDLRRRADYRNEQDAVPVDDSLKHDGDDPSEQTAAAGELARLRKCLELLAPQQRACLLLVYHQGYTPIEVARQKQLPLGTVKTWVRRGLLRVRECLRP